MDEITKNKLQKLFLDAEKKPGQVTDKVRIGQVHVMLRLSRPMWPVMHRGEMVHVKTMDIVQISSVYADCVGNYDDVGDLKTKDMPRGLGAPIYEALEALCRQKGLSLRIECVLSPELRQHYINKHGFVLQGNMQNQAYETSVIKVLGDV